MVVCEKQFHVAIFSNVTVAIYCEEGKKIYFNGPIIRVIKKQWKRRSQIFILWHNKTNLIECVGVYATQKFDIFDSRYSDHGLTVSLEQDNKLDQVSETGQKGDET